MNMKGGMKGAGLTVEEAVKQTSEHAKEWREMLPANRLKKLYEVRDLIEQHADEYSLLAEANRYYNKDDPDYDVNVSANSLNSFGILGCHVTGFISRYEEMSGINPKIEEPVREFKNKKIVKVCPDPTDSKSKALNLGVEGELWLTAGSAVEKGDGNISVHGYGDTDSDIPVVCGIFAPGNYDAPLDVLASLFRNGRVAVLKTHPRCDNLYTIFLKVLAPLFPYLAIISGGLQEGQDLMKHDLVGDVIFTGSMGIAKIIKDTIPDKPLLSELGGVSPYIIVPSVRDWSDSELRNHAEQLIASKMLNGSHICASPQVLITDKSWKQRDIFIKYVKEYFTNCSDIHSFYDHTQDKIDDLVLDLKEKNQNVEVLYEKEKHPNPLHVDRVFVPNLQNTNAAILKKEAFAPILSEYCIDSNSDAKLFLEKTVEFCNNELLGSLCASIIIDKETELSLNDGLDQTICDLNYGGIGVNTFGLALYFHPELVWGASPHNKESGEGWLFNSRMYKHIEKGVVKTDFVHVSQMKLPGKGHRRLWDNLSLYMTTPTWFRLVKVVGSSLIKF